jgi:carboxyl-terminal processing protease
MTHARKPRPLRLPVLAVVAAAALLAGCGGGGEDSSSGPQACSVDGQKTWLRQYFNDWYYWYALGPNPEPGPFGTVQSYFDALLYTGTTPTFPKDRWSGSRSTESFNRFYDDGASMGYGFSVAGLEILGTPDAPLLVRYVEPLSPAASAGMQRGDQVIGLNGRAARDIVAADDFSVLTPDAAGTVLNLVTRRNGVDRNVSITAAIFSLSPVPRQTVYLTAGGRRVGYVQLQNMISQGNTPLANAFSSFRAQGVNDVVLDLRYNGGGLVSYAGTVASHVAGPSKAGQVFANLLYNDKRAAANNSSTVFTNVANAFGGTRVFVLMGRRTCSASEQVINGLRGVGINVIGIGETTCGKPVGFLPQGNCDTTYSVVNFESVNARNEGRYFDGFDATCAQAEDFSKPLGAVDEPLLAQALGYADVGACVQVGNGRERPMYRRSKSDRVNETPEGMGMIAR